MSSDAADGVMAGLKDFQRATVDYVSSRMLDDGARRFLVADEVGLGKTMIARGVVARAVDRLRAEGVQRIDVVYVCSNQEIAKQNLRRLRLPGVEAAEMPSRITLLALHLRDFQPQGVNFVSFTPGTSFEARSRGGWTKERALLLEMLWPIWHLPRHKGIFEFFRLNAKRESLEWELEWLGTPDAKIRARFAEAVEGLPLRDDLLGLAEIARRRPLRDDERERQLQIIGQLRRILAHCSVQELEPDVVILDEFQRFSELLDGETEAAELADQLFSFSNDRGEYARVLLLSATPFKAFSHADESGGSHHVQLHRLLRFLYEDDARAEQVQRGLMKLRERLLSGSVDPHELSDIRDGIQRDLNEVIVRTERLASTDDRNGMLAERTPEGLHLEAGDVREWSELAALHRMLRDRDLLHSGAAVTEYWKSSPWLAQFMDGYQFKQAITEAVETRDGDPELAAALDAVAGQLDWSSFRRYGELAPGNARLRWLRGETVDRTWDLLWIPPSLPYYEPGGVYATEAAQRVTKRLVFSSWDVVPRAIAGYLSYEAERYAQTAASRLLANTPEAREKQDRRLLRLEMRGDQTNSMSVIGLLAPSPALMRLADPLRLRHARGETDDELRATDAVALATRDIRTRLDTLVVDSDEDRPGVDQRWYWAAPLLLDHDDASARAFWERSVTEPQRWTGDEQVGTENLLHHLEEAASVASQGIALGRQPSDLAEVLALLAIAGPSNCAGRALSRVLPDLDGPALLKHAARLGWAFRQLFNGPEAIAIVGGEGPYWRRVLEYCRDGNLQAMLDEWFHVLADDVGAGRRPDDVVADELVDRAAKALGLGASRVEVDPVSGESKIAWRTHFAVRYGQARDETANGSVHPATVRAAFNSPLRPFVLASTSVGQEGLDFHTYCHAIVHWNLPSNPVDLEQREGRVHRYKGHAVRRNVAERFGRRAISTGTPDVWGEAFMAAKDARDPGQDDLVPFWLQPGSAQIERHVPALPYTRDMQRYARVKRQVTLYRMVFGQPRQDDLLAYLQEQLGHEKAAELGELIRIDLSPPSRVTA